MHPLPVPGLRRVYTRGVVEGPGQLLRSFAWLFPTFNSYTKLPYRRFPKNTASISHRFSAAWFHSSSHPFQVYTHLHSLLHRPPRLSPRTPASAAEEWDCKDSDVLQHSLDSQRLQQWHIPSTTPMGCPPPHIGESLQLSALGAVLEDFITIISLAMIRLYTREDRFGRARARLLCA